MKQLLRNRLLVIRSLLVVGFVSFVPTPPWTTAQVPFLGGCPTHNVVKDFNTTAYLGRWYEIEKYCAIFEADGMCIQAYYSDRGDGTVGVMNSQISRKTGQMRSIKGKARPTFKDGTGRFGVSFDSLPFVNEAPYWVLDTDYGNYSIVWSCTDLALFNFQIVWFLAREREPSKELKQQIYDKLDEAGIRRDLLKKTNQTSCDS